jgi:hypothetical protein
MAQHSQTAFQGVVSRQPHTTHPVDIASLMDEHRKAGGSSMPVVVDPEKGITLWSIAEVAARWKISTQTIREQHIKALGLPVTSIANRMLISSKDLIPWERKRMQALRGRIKYLQRMLKCLETLPEHKVKA